MARPGAGRGREGPLDLAEHLGPIGQSGERVVGGGHEQLALGALPGRDVPEGDGQVGDLAVGAERRGDARVPPGAPEFDAPLDLEGLGVAGGERGPQPVVPPIGQARREADVADTPAQPVEVRERDLHDLVDEVDAEVGPDTQDGIRRGVEQTREVRLTAIALGSRLDLLGDVAQRDHERHHLRVPPSTRRMRASIHRSDPAAVRTRHRSSVIGCLASREATATPTASRSARAITRFAFVPISSSAGHPRRRSTDGEIHDTTPTPSIWSTTSDAFSANRRKWASDDRSCSSSPTCSVTSMAIDTPPMTSPEWPCSGATRMLEDPVEERCRDLERRMPPLESRAVGSVVEGPPLGSQGLRCEPTLQGLGAQRPTAECPTADEAVAQVTVEDHQRGAGQVGQRRGQQRQVLADLELSFRNHACRLAGPRGSHTRGGTDMSLPERRRRH